MPESIVPVKRTVELEVPKGASVQDYLLLLRRVLSCPKIISITVTAGIGAKVTYVQVPGEDTLEDRLIPKRTLVDLMSSVPIVRLTAPAQKDGILATLGRIIMESWTEGTPAAYCFVRDREVLKNLVGWRGGTTFMGLQIYTVADFEENMLVIGVASDVLDSLDGIRALYGVTV